MNKAYKNILLFVKNYQNNPINEENYEFEI